MCSPTENKLKSSIEAVVTSTYHFHQWKVDTITVKWVCNINLLLLVGMQYIGAGDVFLRIQSCFN